MAHRFESGRVEAFSDAVFSIAATLLVLEIAVPESDFGDLWSGIADQWPSYLAYGTSFLTIGALWLAHHALFRRTAYVRPARPQGRRLRLPRGGDQRGRARLG